LPPEFGFACILSNKATGFNFFPETRANFNHTRERMQKSAFPPPKIVIFRTETAQKSEAKFNSNQIPERYLQK
jgi:hypothetical protein